MSHIPPRNRFWLPVAFLMLIVLPPQAFALRIEPGLGVGAEYSDNAGLTEDGEDEDLIATALVAAKLVHDTGPLQFDIGGSYTYRHYTHDTFGDKNYFNLDADLEWEIARDRLRWSVQDFFEQRPVDSIEPDTPNNIQNSNLFTTGPVLTLRPGERHALVISPTFRDVRFEDSDTDSRQYDLSANWSYRMSPGLAVGLDGSIRQVEFDDDNNPDFRANSLLAVLTGGFATSTSTYTLRLGVNEFERDRFEDESGLAGNADWSIDLTGRSTARLFIGSELTDAGASALRSAVDPGTGDADNEQISGDVFRNGVLRAEYDLNGSILAVSSWIEVRDLDYKASPQDREIQDVGLVLDYRMTPRLVPGLYGGYNRTELTDADRTDKERIFGGRLAFNLSRSLRTQFTLQYREKNSTRRTDEFEEFSAFLSLSYGFGNIEARGQRAAFSF